MLGKLEINQRRISVLCVEGRTSGAYKVWLIPEDADKLKDERIKNGGYRNYMLIKEERGTGGEANGI